MRKIVIAAFMSLMVAVPTAFAHVSQLRGYLKDQLHTSSRVRGIFEKVEQEVSNI